MLERVNKGNVTIQVKVKSKCMERFVTEEWKKQEECHVHPGVTRDRVITKSILQLIEKRSATAKAGKDEPVGRGMK